MRKEQRSDAAHKAWDTRRAKQSELAESPFTASPYSVPVYTCSLVRDSKITMESRPVLSQPSSIVALAREYLTGVDREYGVVIMLDTKLRVVGINTVAVGALDRATISIPNVFKPAIIANAANIVFIHNHPGGDPAPSAEDRNLTRTIQEAGKLLEIALLDHIVIGETSHFSFKEGDLL